MRGFIGAIFVGVLVVGVASPAHATAFTFQTFDDPAAGDTAEGLGTALSDINNAGQMIGTAVGRVGMYTFLATVNSSTYFQADYWPTGINNNGVVVGIHRFIHTTTGFLYRDGSFATIDDPNGAGTTVPLAINDVGDVVGLDEAAGAAFPFLYSGGVFSAPPRPYPDAVFYPSDINSAGHMVGYSSRPTALSEAYWYGDGAFTPVEIPGFHDVAVWGLNNLDQMVGIAYGPAGPLGFVGVDGAFSTFAVPGADGTYATGINDAGQIVGTYTNGNAFHGFIATPAVDSVPEPASLSLLGVGLVGLLTLRAWRRR